MLVRVVSRLRAVIAGFGMLSATACERAETPPLRCVHGLYLNQAAGFRLLLEPSGRFRLAAPTVKSSGSYRYETGGFEGAYPHSGYIRFEPSRIVGGLTRRQSVSGLESSDLEHFIATIQEGGSFPVFRTGNRVHLLVAEDFDASSTQLLKEGC